MYLISKYPSQPVLRHQTNTFLYMLRLLSTLQLVKYYYVICFTSTLHTHDQPSGC
jgi:hypothetical protein